MSFRINRVYTRTGDDGTTALVGGKRVSKTDLRVQSYGEIDELNSVLGLVSVEIKKNTAELSEVISNLQQELFNLGSELATPSEDAYSGMITTGAKEIQNLENLCEHFGQDLPELKSFILPGGSKLAANLHLARVVARRAERSIIYLSEQGANQVSEFVIKYINRFSDLMFILARWSLKAEGKKEVLWQKPKMP